MFNALFVTLREIAELLLIAQAAGAYLRQAGRGDLARRVPPSMAAGVVIALAMVAWATSHPWDPRVSAAISVLFAAVVLVITSGMLSSAHLIRSRMQLVADAWLERPAAAVWLAAFGAIVGVRETLELAFFLHNVHDAAGAADATAGFVLGVLAAGLLVVAYRSLRTRVNMLSVYRLSTLLMALLSIQLLLKGAGALLHASFPEHTSLLGGLEPFLEGGAWHGWLCAALMLPTVAAMARKWWTESSAS